MGSEKQRGYPARLVGHQDVPARLPVFASRPSWQERQCDHGDYGAGAVGGGVKQAANAMAPEDALCFVEVTPLGIRKVRQFHVRGQVRDEVCANLGDQSIAYDAPFSTTGHDLPSCFRRSPEATPLADDAITLPDDFINTPEWLPRDLEFTPIPCQMLCPTYGWKAWRQKVVHNVRCESG